jgi:16S rRNA C1402 (ribose-2'-O) methylase RsmI
MQIKMQRDCTGSSCGKVVEEFKEGEVYEVSESLAESFVSMGVALIVDGEKAKQPNVNKAHIDSDYENKSSKAKKKGDE